MNQHRSLVLLAVVALAGCAATPAPEPSATLQPGQLVGVWTLDETFADAPEQPYIAFVQDNTWSASDGCNRVQGTWEVEADGTITTTSGPQTRMACDGAQLPVAVFQAERVSVDGDTLVIRSSGDSTVTTLVRTDDPLVGPQGFPVGYWVESNTPESPFLSLSADRTFTGNDGCNTLFGEWSTEEGEVTVFSGVGTTLMACEGVDTWLSGLARATVRAGVMTVQSADGTTIGQLTAR